DREHGDDREITSYLHNFLVVLLTIEVTGRTPLVSIQPRLVGSWLKGPPDTEANDFLFFVKEERKPVDNLILAGVWIIRKDQTKRYIDDRYLDPHFHTQTRPIIAEFREQTFRQSDDAVGLRLTAQKDWLEAGR